MSSAAPPRTPPRKLLGPRREKTRTNLELPAEIEERVAAVIRAQAHAYGVTSAAVATPHSVIKRQAIEAGLTFMEWALGLRDALPDAMVRAFLAHGRTRQTRP